MKYKDYARLTTEQKEEWNFRFKDVYDSPIRFNDIMLFLAVTAMFMFSINFLLDTEFGEDNKIKITQIFNSGVILMDIALVYVGAMVFSYVIVVFYMGYQEHKFRQRCGLK